MFRKSQVSILLDDAIAEGLRELTIHAVTSDEYQKVLDRVVTLNRMKEEDKSSSKSEDTTKVVLGNLLGIIMIIKHESVNVITSRAMSVLLKPITRA